MATTRSRRSPSAAPMTSARALTPTERSLVDVTVGMLPSIQQIREYPAVSVILAVGGPAFGAGDRARGEELVAEAARRLGYEFGPSTVAAIVDPVRRALAEMVGARVEGGVALLRAADELHAFRLSITPTEHVVVDPKFATRDLVRSVAESEPYTIVVLAKDRARLIVVASDGARLVSEIDEANRKAKQPIVAVISTSHNVPGATSVRSMPSWHGSAVVSTASRRCVPSISSSWRPTTSAHGSNACIVRATVLGSQVGSRETD